MQYIQNLISLAYIATGSAVDRVRNEDRQRGATAVEYGLLVALIAAVIIAAVIAFGDTISGIFTDTTAKIAPKS